MNAEQNRPIMDVMDEPRDNVLRTLSVGAPEPVVNGLPGEALRVRQRLLDEFAVLFDAQGYHHHDRLFVDFTEAIAHARSHGR